MSLKIKLGFKNGLGLGLHRSSPNSYPNPWSKYVNPWCSLFFCLWCIDILLGIINVLIFFLVFLPPWPLYHLILLATFLHHLSHPPHYLFALFWPPYLASFPISPSPSWPSYYLFLLITSLHHPICLVATLYCPDLHVLMSFQCPCLLPMLDLSASLVLESSRASRPSCSLPATSHLPSLGHLLASSPCSSCSRDPKA